MGIVRKQTKPCGKYSAFCLIYCGRYAADYSHLQGGKGGNLDGQFGANGFHFFGGIAGLGAVVSFGGDSGGGGHLALSVSIVDVAIIRAPLCIVNT